MRSAIGLNGGPGIDLLLLAYFAAIGWFSWPTLVTLHSRWLDYGYSHGYLVVLAVLVLIARELSKSSVRPAAASVAGSGFFMLCILGSIAAHASSAMFVAQFLLPMLWIGALWSLAGWKSAGRFVLPIGYLYFAIPVWDFLNPLLQSITVTVVSAWLGAVDVPAFIDGNWIHIPSGTFEVAGGCSGLHAFIVGLALAAFAGISHHDRWGPRFILGLCALWLSLLANWLRVFTVIVAGHLTDMQHFLIVTDHYYYGWVLFLVCLSPMFLLDRAMQSDSLEAQRQTDVVGTPSPWPPKRVALLSVVVVTTGVGLWLQSRVFDTDALEERRVEILLPGVPGWRPMGEWADTSQPSFPGVSGAVAEWYGSDAARLAVFLGHYSVQRQEREVVFHANRPEGETGEVLARTRVSVPAISGSELPFTELEVADAAEQRRLVWLGIRVAGRLAGSDLAAKALQVLGVLSGRRDAQVLVLMTPCTAECEEARVLLADFAIVAAETLYVSAERSAD